MQTQTQTEIEKQHGGARNGAGRKPKLENEQSQLELLETRATELRKLLDAAQSEAQTLDDKVSGGDFAQAGAATTARVHFDTLTRALDAVTRDIEAERARIAEAAAASARASEIKRLAQIARDIARLNEQSQNAALELAAQIESRAGAIYETRARAVSLRNELRAIHESAPDVLADALPLELAAQIGYRGDSERASWRPFDAMAIFTDSDPSTHRCGKGAVVSALTMFENRAVALSTPKQAPRERPNSPLQQRLNQG